MTVKNGNKGNEDVFNGAFGSRTSPTSIASIWDFQNDSAESGQTVENIQRVVNLARVESFAIQSIGGDSIISSDDFVGHQYRPIVSTGGEVALSGAVFGSVSSMELGRTITLIGTHNTNYVRLNPEIDFASIPEFGILLNGPIFLQLGVNVDLTLVEIAGKKVFLERSRSL